MSLLIQNLTVEVGGKAVVTGASLAVGPGKITAVLGPNGSGKSELVLGVAGVLTKCEGRVFCDGQDISKLGPAAVREHGVAVVPEGHQVLPSLSVDDNLRAAASGLDVDVEAELENVYGIFPELAERKAQLAGSMSGGQQQMVALGHALMARPKYLLVDEMSLGLAPLIVRRLADVIRSLAQSGTGVLLIEQFTDMALGLADHAYVLRQGRVAYEGDTAKLQNDAELLKRIYLGS